LLLKSQQIQHVLNEKDILLELRGNPLFAQIRGTLKDEHHIHFLLQPVLGGELSSVLAKQTVLDEPTVRFVAGNIVLAFQYLHRKGIVYRDLKPENVLLDKEGYPKLVDFGFAKRIDGERTNTKCGTPDYMAPEIISSGSHFYAADWWTLGVLIYEMLVGDPPFFADNPYKVMSNILEGNISFPEDDAKPTEEAMDIVHKLLCKDPEKRLGTDGKGVEEIKSHPFFAKHSFDWQGALERQLDTPGILVAPVQNEEDLSNFQDLLGEDESWEDYVPEPDEDDPFTGF
jgi:serine/threonine protein kinase